MTGLSASEVRWLHEEMLADQAEATKAVACQCERSRASVKMFRWEQERDRLGFEPEWTLSAAEFERALDVRENCQAAIHFPKELHDSWYGRDTQTTLDDEFRLSTLARWDDRQFIQHRAPAIGIASHPGYESEHGYLDRAAHEANEERMAREYSTEPLFTRSKRDPANDICLDGYTGPAIDLTGPEGSYELAWLDGKLYLQAYTTRTFPGLCAYETERRKAQAAAGQTPTGAWVDRRTFKAVQDGGRARARAKKERAKIAALLTELGYDPRDEKIAARVRELGYDATIRRLYSVRRQRAALSA